MPTNFTDLLLPLEAMDYTLFDKYREESQSRMEVLSRLKRGAHIHLSAICGTGMGSVAALLKQQGFYITGSDKRFYPPMGDIVRGIAEKLYEGYDERNLDATPALVVIGNNLSADNPEVQRVMREGIPYASMPEVFGALLVGDYDYCGHSVVVTGTHGKTTTSAAVATILESAQLKPGYFIGGVPLDLPGGIRPPDFQRTAEERIVVLEGDEYDSAFFAKWPKFLSYRPDVLIITSIEFDHADIYESLYEIEQEFARLVSMMPKDGVVIVSTDGDALQRNVPLWRRNAPCKILTYGSEPYADLRILSRKPTAQGQELEFQLRDCKLTATANLGGLQNAMNFLAAAGAAEFLGLTPERISEGIASFHGVLRRQTNHGSLVSKALFIEDFAHHPTAIKLTLDGLKEQHPAKALVAAYEPRSNTSMRSFFQEDYVQAFDAADVVLLLVVGKKEIYSNTSSAAGTLDVEKLAADLSAKGKKVHVLPEASQIGDWILANTGEKDLVVCMSNGDFGGLIQRLKATIPGAERLLVPSSS